VNRPPGSDQGGLAGLRRGRWDIENLAKRSSTKLVDAGLVKTFADLTPDKEHCWERSAWAKRAPRTYRRIQAARPGAGAGSTGAGLGITARGIAWRTCWPVIWVVDARWARVVKRCRRPRIGEVIADSVTRLLHTQPANTRSPSCKKVGSTRRLEKVAAKAEPDFRWPVRRCGNGRCRVQRDEIERLIVRLGGKAWGSVSKEAPAVVAGAKRGAN